MFCLLNKTKEKGRAFGGVLEFFLLVGCIYIAWKTRE